MTTAPTSGDGDMSNLLLEAEHLRLGEEEAKWQQEEGIPQFSDPFIQKYTTLSSYVLFQHC